MKDKQLDDEEKAILEAVRENPELKNCMLEMIGITHARIGELKIGDDAEEEVVKVIRKTGNVLLQEWAEKREKEAEKAARQDKSLRPHGKKKSLGKHL
jgi:uncharacterized protein YwlG (UPF0340 family)